MTKFLATKICYFQHDDSIYTWIDVSRYLYSNRLRGLTLQ